MELITAEVLVVGHPNGDVDYYGPFVNEDRAKEYALSLPTDTDLRWHVKPLIVPYLSKFTHEKRMG